MPSRFLITALVLIGVGCSTEDARPPIRFVVDGGAPIDAPILDVDAPLTPAIDASAMPDAGTIDGTAPAGTIPGEVLAFDGDVEVVAASATPAIIRIEAEPSEHITFFLSFTPSDADVEVEVLRWDGSSAVSLGSTDAGPGLRTLAVFDPSGPRTFWARITTPMRAPLAATLAITRVPFNDAALCTADCAHLLQLPLPNDAARDGYRSTAGTVYRYQYGRRDLVMFIRHAGQRMVSLGLSPFVPQDLSQWNAETPGNDVGAPRHASHQRGKDVDISLYGIDGVSAWRSYCTAERTSSGRECIPGTMHDYDGTANAVFFGDFFATGSVTMCFLDQELHPETIAGAADAVASGDLDSALVPLYSDGRHLQHWPNHDNHIHIRVAEEMPAGFVPSADDAMIEPP